jgi:transposase
VHHIVLEDYIAAVEAAAARRDRLTAQIEAMLPDWTLAPVVAALQTMRGMALVKCGELDRRTGRPLALCQSAPADGLSRAGAVPANVVTAAIARELAGFIWAIARRVPPAAG